MCTPQTSLGGNGDGPEPQETDAAAEIPAGATAQDTPGGQSPSSLSAESTRPTSETKNISDGLLKYVSASAVVYFMTWFHKKKMFSDTIQQRCSEYVQDPKTPVSGEVRKKIEEEFGDAFLIEPFRYIKEQDYKKLIELIDQIIPENKVLLWSKTQELVPPLAEKLGLIPVADTMVGYIGEGLKLPGARGPADAQTERFAGCFEPPAGVFWDTVSKSFAENASGEVVVVLNASVPNAYDKNSTFARMEVPNLNKEKVSVVHLLLIPNGADQVSDPCSSPSILELKKTLDEMGIAHTCRVAASIEDLMFLSPEKLRAVLAVPFLTASEFGAQCD